MNKLVSIDEFQARARELMREVEESGQTIVVTERGKPLVEIRALSEPEKAEFRLQGTAEDSADPLELLRGSVLFYERPLDPVGEDDWEALSEP